ncbi:sensor histidine kinase [Tropicimonas isoalkanivorans]|uniref:histidine kinase n=1 Tax=Tropicimonas isoalkanivorans TaxID=441112 RepID=A0A1I1P0V6_9RHOB|nr:sensor histidine kinase [Tropicimonas isoalkanivorans]SFD03459.1 signal transduction histidine kinase [Tropicimonas isoalkanivorans]
MGLIAVWQTTRLEVNLEEVNALNLIALTGQVAQHERETIDAAFGAATALAAFIPELTDDPTACSDAMKRFKRDSEEQFAFAGFLPVSGQMTCSTVDHTVDLTLLDDFSALMRAERPNIMLEKNGTFSDEPVLVASLPVVADDGGFAGYVSISVPQARFDNPYDQIIGNRKMDLFTVNSAGEILTSSTNLEVATERLPGDRLISDMVDDRSQRFDALNGAGERRVYSVVPIVEGVVYAVGAWSPPYGESSARPLRRFLGSPALFPIIMWLASLLLVIMAVEWLVVRHVRVIAGQLRRFARNRELPIPPPEGSLPNELEIIEREFSILASRLLRDEAELLDAMHDKDVLLKEVHHRVKNNLQLISSIINMQVRRTKNKATAGALERVNTRVTSMAAVHRRLYQAESLGRVRADELLRDVVTPLTDMGTSGNTRPRVELRLDPVVLYPDQAVPAALLAVEAVTNALKYIGTDESGDCWVRVSLEMLDDDHVRLSIQSSIASDGEKDTADESGSTGAEGTGLGMQLIRAFARQLESKEIIEEGPYTYTLSVVFTPAPFEAIATTPTLATTYPRSA